MFFTRIQKALQDKVRKRIHANQPIPNKESICDICQRRAKKLLDPLAKGQQIGKRKKKKERPHKLASIRKHIEKLQLKGELQIKRQSAWINTEKGIQLVIVSVNIKKEKIKALVDLRANKSYIYQKTTLHLQI